MKADAVACVRDAWGRRVGWVKFFQRRRGVLVEAEFVGLPDNGSGFFALHIHEGPGYGGADFPETGGHYNPCGVPHPMHAGDLPPVLRRRDGRAWQKVSTDRFRVCHIMGRTVVLHSMADDFHTQPAGNPGEKLACGVIQRNL